ncbi:MAG: thioredoxin domain-containing protein [Anaerolineae bacterium]|nr:thioredoxin domain-containing protein [Anaerolineae bacterium]
MSKRKKTSQNRLVGFSIGAVVILLGAAGLLLANSAASTPLSTPTAALSLGDLNRLDQVTAAPTPTPTMGEIMTFFADDDPALGPEEAPVVIVEFSDYLCPYCGVFTLETLPRILESYPEEVRFVHRDAPVLEQETAFRVAMAAGCAEEQGQFWSMHEEIFGLYEGVDLEAIEAAKASGSRDRGEWDSHLTRFSAEALRGMAEGVGLDLAAYETCMAGEERSTEVVIDLQTAMQLGIRGVPAYIINGQLVSGARPFEDFARLIDSALNTRPITG